MGHDPEGVALGTEVAVYFFTVSYEYHLCMDDKSSESRRKRRMCIELYFLTELAEQLPELIRKGYQVSLRAVLKPASIGNRLDRVIH